MHRSNLTRSERWLERGLGTVVLLALALGLAADVRAQGVLNLYSARHYQTDEALYSNFTKATGIRINRVEADDAGILARLKAEGSASPADVILLVGGARSTHPGAAARRRYSPGRAVVWHQHARPCDGDRQDALEAD
jgi:hypothetical protein